MRFVGSDFLYGIPVRLATRMDLILLEFYA